MLEKYGKAVDKDWDYAALLSYRSVKDIRHNNS